MILLLFSFVFSYALSVSATKVLIKGWYRNDWKNNVFQPLNIDCVTSDSWVDISDWEDYDLVVITESQPQLTQEQVTQIESWVAAGHNLILSGTAVSYMSPTGNLDLTGLQNLVGFKSYVYSAGTTVEQKIINARHQLTNHFEEGETLGRDHNSYWFGGVTTAEVLVGELTDDPSKPRATVLVNEVGLGKVFSVASRPSDPNAQKHILLCKKMALLGCGFPVAQSPTNVIANRVNSGSITLAWTPPAIPEGGTEITKYWIYRDTTPNVSLDSERVATIEVDEGFQPAWTDDSLMDYQSRGTSYYYAVVAVDSNHLMSDLSEVAVAAALLGTVKGRVVEEDDNDAGIYNAEIILVDQETQSTRTARTDESGYYQFDDVIAGNYKLFVRAPLYLVDEQDIEVRTNETTISDFVLVKDTRKTDPPGNFSVISSEENPGVIELSWTAPLNEPYASYFRIYRSLDRELLEENYSELVPIEIPAPEQPCPPGELVRWEDYTVVAGKTYYYLVTALTGSLVESDPTPILSASAFSVNIPTMLYPINGEPIDGVNVTFEWGTIENAKQYIIQYADNVEFNNAISILVDAPQTSLTQTSLAEGKWFWRIAVVLNSNAQSDFSAPSSFSIVCTDSEKIGAEFFSIRPEYVSSASFSTITFMLNNPSVVSLAIYDLKGKLIKQLYNKQKFSVGITNVDWDLKDSTGRKVANGLYLVCLTLEDDAKNVIQVRKGIVIYK